MLPPYSAFRGWSVVQCTACLLVFAGALLPATNIAQQEKPLIFGLLPSESAVTKFKRYAPLRDYLSKHLKRKVILETARDFPEFIRRTGQRQYDFLETAPHFVPRAVDSGHYIVLTTILQPLSAQIVVLKGSKYKSIGSLARQKVATPSPKAIITKIGKVTFVKAGLQDAKAPVYQTYKTHNAAYEAVLGGLAEAAVISVNIYNKALREKEPLVSIGESQHIPNMSIIAATNLSANFRNKLQGLLVKMKSEPEGKRVLTKIAYPGYRQAEAKEYNVLRRYIKK